MRCKYCSTNGDHYCPSDVPEGYGAAECHECWELQQVDGEDAKCEACAEWDPASEWEIEDRKEGRL